MCKLILGMVTAVILMAAPAAAAGQSGRYAMSPVSEGMLRLDTVTGAVSLCRAQEQEWSCEGVADSELDLQRDVDRLREENDALRAELEQARAQAARRPSDEDDAAKKQDRLVPDAEAPSPGEETIDQMVTVLEKMMRRFRDMIESLEEKKDERQL